MNRQDAKFAKDEARREPGEKIDAMARSAIGAAIEVHRVQGPGFLECVYGDALAVELQLRAIPFDGIKHVVHFAPLGDLGALAVQEKTES